ncbi:hypothetical protein GOBAR_DD05727 [Gossypium barbadense]|nr:hypothetical protein GOBAR_DD05727 [Gossypium barbadense]
MSSSQALDWRKLFDSPSDQSLVFFPPEVHGGSITVKPLAEGLSYIASALGTPFYMDNITTLQQRLAYVKMNNSPVKGRGKGGGMRDGKEGAHSPHVP